MASNRMARHTLIQRIRHTACHDSDANAIARISALIYVLCTTDCCHADYHRTTNFPLEEKPGNLIGKPDPRRPSRGQGNQG
jgi:hypothetical protein